MFYGVFFFSTQIRNQLKKKAYEEAGLSPPAQKQDDKPQIVIQSGQVRKDLNMEIFCCQGQCVTDDLFVVLKTIVKMITILMILPILVILCILNIFYQRMGFQLFFG